jgi:hypothetical protein
MNPIKYFIFVVLGLGLWTPLGFAQRKGKPLIQLFTDPSRSRNGEPVLVKIRIEADFSDSVGELKGPQLKDWKLLKSYRDQTTLLKMTNGERIQRRIVEHSLILKPLKKGNLLVPSFEVEIASKKFRTAETQVMVDAISNQPSPPSGSGPPSQGPFVGRPGQNLWGNSRPQMRPQTIPNPFGSVPDDSDLLVDIPPRENLFVRALPSKTEGYVGELFNLSYRVFQRKPMRLDEPTISKFPDFKGFLKEELAIPRAFSPSPVRIQGENFLQFELIRFAVFPLKEGNLRIDPLQFRSKVFMSAADLLEDMLNGRDPDPTSSQGVPMEKFSQSLDFKIKPLPRTPAGVNFGGAVGRYQASWSAPTQALPPGQPFSIELTLEGVGNLKAIEEPILTLPQGMDPYQTLNRYEFRDDASGFKTFEYLILPKESGNFKIGPLKWTYFNPENSKYESIVLPQLEIEIKQGAKIAKKSAQTNKDGNADEVLESNISPYFANLGKQVSFSILSRRGWSGVSEGIWFSLLTIFFGLGIYFSILKRRVEDLMFLRNNPWEKTARQIRDLKSNDSLKGLSLIDLWIRQKLHFTLRTHRPDLMVENEREVFFEALQVADPQPQTLDALKSLKKIFEQMDLMRFANESRKIEISEVKKLFEEAHGLVQNFQSPRIN